MSTHVSCLVAAGNAVEFEMCQTSSASDALLLSAAKQGKREAFDELCRRHSSRLFRTLQRITRNKEDAEDSLQDAMLSAFIHLKDFDGRSSFSTWLTRIAINCGLMSLRKSRRVKEISIDGDCEFAFDAIPARVTDQNLNPETLLQKSERTERVRIAVGKLRPPLRKVVEMNGMKEYSLRETAVLLGISIAAAKARLFRSRYLLRRSLRVLGPQSDPAPSRWVRKRRTKLAKQNSFRSEALENPNTNSSPLSRGSF